MRFKALTVYFIFCLIICGTYGLSLATEGKKEITIRVPKDAPRISLLEQNFVLINSNQTTLPDFLASIHHNWQELLKKHNQNVFSVSQIPLPAQHKQQWANLTKLLPKMDSTKKLRNINGFFNSIPSQDDAYNYKAKEYWATPFEFLQKRAGDCEDYAIAKYFALQYFSWPAQDLWIVFLRDNINEGLHAVLATRHQNKGFILDNLSRPPQLLIPEKQYAKQVTVIAMLNESGIWLPLKQ